MSLPLPRGNSYSMVDWRVGWGMIQLLWPNLGLHWRVSPTPELYAELAKASVTAAVQFNFSLCPILHLSHPLRATSWGGGSANLHLKNLLPPDLQYVKNTVSKFLLSLRSQVKMSNKKLEMWAKAQEKDLGRKEIWEPSTERWLLKPWDFTIHKWGKTEERKAKVTLLSKCWYLGCWTGEKKKT